MLQSILDRLQPEWVVNYHEHDSLLEHVFSEELSEEERKAAWAEYKEQLKFDSANYYSALQNQLDTSGQPTEVHLASKLMSGPLAGPSVNVDLGVIQNAQQSHQANELLTVLSNTNRNVQSLIHHLQEKGTLTTTLLECQRHRVPIPPNLTALMNENRRSINAHYGLVQEGVKRVNATLQMCQMGQINLDPSANKLANELRSKLIKSLDVLRSGSTQPAVRSGAVGSGVSVSLQDQAAILQHARQVAQDSLRQGAALLKQDVTGLNVNRQ